jgi:serine phosphatase RsbU (regulator of sigma subunit)
MNISFLQDISLFASLEPAELQAIAQCMRLIDLPSGAFLFHEGDIGDRFYIILSGQLEVIKALGSPEERLIHVRGAGEFIGEMSLFDPSSQRSAAVRAQTQSQVLEMCHDSFQELLQTHPLLAYQVTRELSLRLRASDDATIQDLREKNRQLAEAYEALKAAQAQVIEKEKLERELQLARKIQQSMLPQVLPSMPGFSFGARMVPARAVGGDLFDFIPLSRDRLGIMIGDVSDKGVPAALFMALSRSLVRAEALRSASPAEVLHRVNYHLASMNLAGMFVTMLYGVLHRTQRTFSYARGGHEMPLLYDGHAAQITIGMDRGMLVGLFPEITLDEQTVTLPPRGTLFLYTDGATDAVDASGERFMFERLQPSVQAELGVPAQDLCDRVLAAIQAYSGDTPQADDITLVAVSSA